MGSEAAFLKFYEYEDADGFYFLSYMKDCSGDDVFEWDYYPPGTFKILIYLPADDRFLTDGEIHERYAFDSYFSVKVNDGEMTADTAATVLETKRSYDFTLEIFSLLARVVLTVLVEIALAWIFKYRNKKSLSIIVCINIATQIVLNALLNVINYKSGQWAFAFNYFWMEFVVFGIEAVLYKKVIGCINPVTGKKYHPYVYAFVANLASFVVGMWIARVIPGIF